MPYVVESKILNDKGQVGTARIYVATEARARELAAAPGAVRTWRPIEFLDMPEVAVARMRGE